MRSTLIKLCIAALASGATAFAVADDGEINNKSMSRTINVPIFDQDIVNNAVSEAEHAFTDMMGFYVPAQAASGEPAGDGTGLITYNNIDGNLVEELPVAKPLVNVFIYGPAFGVPETAFAHRYFDTYAAVSLDDGVTWKQTNLSNSANLSSFNIDEDHKEPPSSGKPPQGHNIELCDNGSSADDCALHASGYDTPYTAHCTECHGQGLTGTGSAPSCYSCHENIWSEDPPVETGPIIYEAEAEVEGNKASLDIEGENGGEKEEIHIINAITGHLVGTTESEDDGKFEFEEEYKGDLPPCVVYAEYTDNAGTTYTGPAVYVIDDDTGEPIENCEGLPLDVTDYPGGTYNVFHATAGNKTLVAWPSRFCERGQPAYQMSTETNPDLERLDAVTDFIREGDVDLGVDGLPDFTSPIDGDTNDDLYLTDAYGVAGSQGSIDFADEGYPQAGIVPFGCVWASRGILLPGDDPRTEALESSHMVWTQAERLTSGRRDPNRIEVKGVKDAGFVITWQEDPDGLRPGQGLGPGEGWSGAVAHAQTDVWYSFINWEYFDVVETTDNTTVPINVLDHDLLLSGRPQVYVPMAVPMRLTNNAKCNPADDTGAITDDLYCDIELAAIFGLKDQCADEIDIPVGPADELQPICVGDSDGDGVADLPNRANTASTRPRLGLQGWGDDTDMSGWVVVTAEESKGLGAFFFTPDGLVGGDFDGYADPCTEGDDYPCTEEIGKNIWYFSFDMGTPDTSAGIGLPNSLVENLTHQGNMMNQAEVFWETGEHVGLMSTEEMWDYGDYNFDIVNTEIARRGSLLIQGIAKAVDSDNHLAAIPSWKQGVMRQGGPADTMLRRVVLPCQGGGPGNPNANPNNNGKGPGNGNGNGNGNGQGGNCRFNQTIDNNPYAFENMACEAYLIDPDTNPYYPGGVCRDPAINLSAVVPDTCLDDDTGGLVDCPKVDCDAGTEFCIGDTQPILQGLVQGEGNTQRVLTWHQCPSEGQQTVGDFTAVTCEDDDRTDDFVNLLDQSWYNPLDISKGHRGFIDGDFVQFLYAWSPTWRLNAKGNDRYELYVRRSFDGGETWATTPSSFQASDGNTYSGDGTITCESYRSEQTGVPQAVEPKVCYEFAAGAAEHARNITQHRSMRITTLDPRYAPTKASIVDGCTDGLFLDDSIILDLWTCDDTSVDYDSDERDPSRYFMVYETGDNTTVEAGEAEPLDLFYARAESFGDDYVVWTETDTDSANPEDCFPTTAYDVTGVAGTILEGSGFCNEFDRMNTGGDTHSSEANLESNPDGSKLYGVWAQWSFDDTGEEVDESDAMARRIWWIDDYISLDNSYTLPGTSQTGTPDPQQ